MHWIEAHVHAVEYERDIIVRDAARDASIRRALEAERAEKAPAPFRQPSFIRRLVLGQ